jgi:hypothetical protein
MNHRCGRRNVRLKKGFVNVERAPFGGMKLRIPTLLFVEKMRTQSRFNVSQPAYLLDWVHCIKTRVRPRQLMRMEASQQQQAVKEEEVLEGKDRKPVHNASSKVSLVVQRMLFPLLDSPMRTHVQLDTEVDQLELDLLDQVGRNKPGLLEDQQSFVQHLLQLMERYKRGGAGGGGYARVSTGEGLG